MKKAAHVIGIILLASGILLFIIGAVSCMSDTSTHSETYHKVYRDSSGTWRGTDVTWDAPNVTGSGKAFIGLGMTVVGGIMTVATSPDKDDKSSGDKNA